MTKDEALDLALEALEKSEPNKRKGDDDYCEIGWMEHRKAITAIKQARSAPVQEPVAWMYEDMMGLVGVRVQKEKPIVARPVTPLCLCNPPAAQRQWVGLTDEDIAETDWHLSADREYEQWTLQEQLVVCGVKDFARAIDAKLKEKNTCT